METTLNIAKKLRKSYLEKETLDTEEYNEFKKKYPKFYEMMITKDMDKEMFNKMMSLLSTNVASDPKVAFEFSQFGAEKYVYPQFGKPTEEDLNTAKDKINNLR